MQGLELLKARGPDLADRLRVRLVGAIEQQDSFLAAVRARGVDGVLDTQGVLSHDEALAVQRRADALLILGVEESGPEVQVPGKLYEYFAARRPVLTLSRKGGAIQEALALARFPYELGEPDDPADIADALERFLRRFADGELEYFDDEGIAQFRYDRLTERLRDCFQEALELSVPDFAEGERRPSHASAP